MMWIRLGSGFSLLINRLRRFQNLHEHHKHMSGSKGISKQTFLWISLTGSCLPLSRPWQKWPLYSSEGTGAPARPATENDTFETLHNIKLKETEGQ